MRSDGKIGTGLVVVILVIVALLLSGLGIYNGLVSKDAAVERSFADLDAQLQRRADLVPNVVAAVRGILNQEQTVFGEIARARQNYAGAATPREKFDASNQLDSAISRLLVIVEQYPQLRSSESVRDLMVQLEGTENRIAQARRDYNGVVTGYNVAVRRFPRSLFAGLFGFRARPLFRASPASREVPRVDIGGLTPSPVAPSP